MKEAVELLVKSLVRHPDAVEVQEIPRDGRTTILEIRVQDTDMGPLIGRQGRTIRALRAIFDAVSQKHHHRYILEIVE
jgi:hypothetical protein